MAAVLQAVEKISELNTSSFLLNGHNSFWKLGKGETVKRSNWGSHMLGYKQEDGLGL